MRKIIEMKNVKMLLVLLVGLQTTLLQAVIIDGVCYPEVLEQGFQVLKSQDESVPEFEDFVIKILQEKNEGDNRDNEILTPQAIIIKAQDYIAAGVKQPFLQAIENEINQKIENVRQIQNPIFRYVMQTDSNDQVAMADSNEIQNFIINKARNEKWFDDVKGDRGKTLLHLAAYNNSIGIAKMLILLDANVNAKNEEDLTPLMYAADRGSEEILRVLLDKNADINAVSKSGITALMFAVHRKDVCNYEIA